MPYKPEQREYRDFSAMLAPPPQATSEKHFATEFYVEGCASSFNKPYVIGREKKSGLDIFEVISSGALDGCDLSDVIMQYDHAGTVFARTSNNTLYIDARAEGLYMAADLGKTAAAREKYDEISQGFITRMSFSFIVAKEHFDKATRTRVIEKLKKVYDVSAVSIPANAATAINARSGVERIVNAYRQELQREQRKRILLKIKLNGGN